MDAAIAAVTSAGGLVFCSAGNKGSDVDTKLHYPSSYSETNNQVVSVGASDASGNLWSRSNYGVKGGVTLAAPGVSVLGLGLAGTYVRQTGTSMSSKQSHLAFSVSLLLLSVIRTPTLQTPSPMSTPVCQQPTVQITPVTA